MVDLRHMKVHIEFPNGQLIQGLIQNMEIEQSTTRATTIKLEAIVLDAKVLCNAWNSNSAALQKAEPPEPPEPPHGQQK